VIFAFFLGDLSEVILLLLSVPIDGYGLCEGAHTHEHEDWCAIELGRFKSRDKIVKGVFFSFFPEPISIGLVCVLFF